MAILALENEIELVVTWVCNWRCEYCSVDTHNRPELAWDTVVEKLASVPENSTVTLSGGEVGSLKRGAIEYILETLENKNCTININTNGLFIKRYPDLLNRFSEILYHCSEDLDITDEIIINNNTNIQYLLIVTDNNYHKLEAFLDKYPQIVFNLVAASNPEHINNVTLSNRLKHQMLARHHSRMTQDSIKRVFTEKDFNSIVYI